MSAHWEPKIGDVVTLKSEPDRPMTVIGYDIKAKVYGVMWIGNDGQGHAVNMPAEAMSKHNAEELANTQELSDGIRLASEEIQRLKSELESSQEACRRWAKELHTAMPELQKIVPPEAHCSDLSTMALEAARRHVTMKTEANAQIERLQRAVRELGG